MGYLLQLDSSADLRTSVSRRLTADFAAAWLSAHPDRTVVHRDLHVNPPPHLPTNALHFSEEARPAHSAVPSADAVSLQSELVAELSAAAAVVIGAPMYNFGVPSPLKAWLDYVHLIGVTSPAQEGIAPLRGKPVVVISPRGTPTGVDPHADFVLGSLRVVLGDFMAMDVTGFAVHGDPPAQPGDFNRPVDVVRDELIALARAVG